MDGLTHRYLVGLGSNQRIPAIGSPRKVLAAALTAMVSSDCAVIAVSPMIDSAPVGPSHRRYANGVVLIDSRLGPLDLLIYLQQIEAQFGRNRRGQRWRARTLDLDILLWSGGLHASPDLSIPHPAMRERPFVLAPAAIIAGSWRDPISGLSLRHLLASLTKSLAVPR